ncbi:TetR/AcrR family transcriptional regulator [Microlunatus parietis]|uniref:AcrR family transcriptional regulator n=1 Tax=Microlunatus parietis TaxID=682979 RepID=A0A7Y9LCV2_9ACTN|nr:TetR/AcrR family transcriptional regulator [Microlunatus parietis]NYE71311.1 AcrR family transcriptional regulator [Microlunatus parietis]
MAGTQEQRTRALRADAQQNVERILEAAISCLGTNPEASMAEIAKAAGVGRVTLYGHFPSREVLVEAALTRLLERGEEALRGIDLTGDPRDVLAALIESSWLLTAQAGSVLVAAQALLPPGRVHEMHAEPERRLIDLIRRGQSEGVFRKDLSAAWLANVVHYLMKGAAADVSAGRLDRSEVPNLIAATMDGVVQPRFT